MKNKIILPIFLFAFAVFLTQCNKVKDDEIITYTVTDSFKGIVYSGQDELTIKYGTEHKVEATGKKSDIDNLLQILFIDSELNIERDNGTPESLGKIEYVVTTPELRYVTASGKGDINVEDFNQTYDPIFFIEYLGDININNITGVNKINVQIEHSGNFNALSPISNLDELIVGITGAESVPTFGSFNGFNISSKTCTARIYEEGGDINVTVQDSLHVEIGSNGNGDVNYKGFPVITTDISGTGSVVDMN